MKQQFIYQEITSNKDLPFRLLIHTDTAKKTVISHWHKSLEITFVVSGSIEEYYLDGNTFKLQENEMVIINPYSIHSIKLNDCLKRVAVTLMFPNTFFQYYGISLEDYPFLNPTQLKMTDSQAVIYQGMLKKFQQLYHFSHVEPNPAIKLKIISLALDILSQLMIHFKAEPNKKKTSSNKENLSQLEKIMQFIEDNYHQNLTTQMIADHFYLSRPYLARYFKNLMGISLYQYIIQIRLRKAHQLVLNSNDSVEQISILVGFPNKKAFTKAFKEVYQLTPYQYRLNNLR